MKSARAVNGGVSGILLKRYARFCVVGATGVAVDMGMIYLLADPLMLGWNLTLSKAIAAEVAIFNNFLWNDHWTFCDLASESPGWPARLIRLGRFNLICVAGIALSVLLLNIQVYGLHMHLYPANLVSIGIVSSWNFLMNLRFGWNQSR